MITLTGGPAEGTYAVARAPLYLRAVVAADGKRDVCDLLTDEPRAGESVHVYRQTVNRGHMHINRGGRGSGFYAVADYEHMPDVDGEALREADAWREWANAQP